MADAGVPNNPIIHVIHLNSDIAPDEPGLVSVHDQLTGATTVQDADKYLWPQPRN